ncbi:MAG TPA: hypothetical protein VE085_02515 [Burkholderiales bacterium]|nr:hypothetical protein [Burkholderiales bacterium]
MSDTVAIALIGLTGAVIGSLATVVGNIALHCLKERSESKREKPQRDLLLAMLKSPDYQWRRLDTLMHVIGTEEQTTKRLLLEVGARASEDGQPLWGLIERNPLPRGKQ